MVENKIYSPEQPRRIDGDFEGKDIISISQFDRSSIDKILDITSGIKGTSDKRTLRFLEDSFITLLMLEPSTRTWFSFSAAVQRCGGKVGAVNASMFLQIPQGEDFDNYVKGYGFNSDAIVIRHPQKNYAQRAADNSTAPVINAGDGVGEHPTQALLDIFTLRKYKGRVDNLTGLLAGDMLNGRTVHSLIQALSLYNANEIYLLSDKNLRLAGTDYNKLSSLGIKLHEINDETQIPKGLDFWYWTRVQKERFEGAENPQDYKRFIITPEFLEKYAGKNTIIMHPLPRNEEIDAAVDKDPRAVYFDQAANGMYVRMALLGLVLGRLR